MERKEKKPDLPTWTSGRVARLREAEAEEERRRRQQRDGEKGKDGERRSGNQHRNRDDGPSSDKPISVSEKKVESGQKESWKRRNLDDKNINIKPDANAANNKMATNASADAFHQTRGTESTESISQKPPHVESRPRPRPRSPAKDPLATSQPSSSSHHLSKPATISPTKRSTPPKKVTSPSPSSSSLYNSSISNRHVNSNPFRRNPSKPLGGEIDVMGLLSSPSRGIDKLNESIREMAVSDSSKSLNGQEDEEGIKDLTHFSTQEKFRSYISKKIEVHSANYPSRLSPLSSTREEAKKDSRAQAHSDPSNPSTSSSNHKSSLLSHFEMLSLPPPPSTSISSSIQGWRKSIEKERSSIEEILLLIRKLREGIVASHREVDDFVIDVYTLSTYFSLLVGNHSQLKSSLNKLVLDLYPEFLRKRNQNRSQEGSDREDGNGNRKMEDRFPYRQDLRLLLPDLDDSMGSSSSRDSIPNSTSTPTATATWHEQDEFHHLSSILLLSILCLPFGSGTLGSHASENNAKGQRVEYQNVKRRIDEEGFNEFQVDSTPNPNTSRESIPTPDPDLDPSLHPHADPSTSTTNPHLQLAESISTSIQASDGLKISNLLKSQKSVINGINGDLPTAFQRLLILQKLISVRQDSWKVLKKSYLAVALPLPLAPSTHSGSDGNGNGNANANTNAEEVHASRIEKILVLDLKSIPLTPEEMMEIETLKGEKRAGKDLAKVEAEVPEEWDHSINSSNEGEDRQEEVLPSATETEVLFQIRMQRLARFLASVSPSPSTTKSKSNLPSSSSSIDKSDGTELSDSETIQRIEKLESFKNLFIPKGWSDKVSISKDGKSWNLSLR